MPLAEYAFGILHDSPGRSYTERINIGNHKILKTE